MIARLKLFTALLTGLLAGTVQAGEVQLEQLLADIAPDERSFAAAYEETRESGLMDEPVVVKGTIHYRYPGQLEKTEELEDGSRREIHVGDGVVRVMDEDGERSTRLSRVPELAALMAVLDAFARGDAAAMEEQFQSIEVHGDIEQWRLELEARDPPTPGRGGGSRNDDPLPLRLELSGSGDWIERIQLDAPRQGRIRFRITEELE